MSVNILVQAFLLSALLLAAALRDIKTREVKPIFCGLISLLFLLDFRLENLLGMGIPLILWLTAAYLCPDRLGGGDIKLCFATSLVLGFSATAYGVMMAFFIVICLFLALRCFKSKEELSTFSIPLAPFLALSFLTTYFMKLGGYIL